ncbi:MAG: hypothetical protein ABIK75_07010 [candidate division WOR-3 bacterium]
MKIEIYDIKEFTKKDMGLYLGGLLENIRWQLDLQECLLYCYTDYLTIVYNINKDEMKIYLKNYNFLKKIIEVTK